MKLHGLTRQIFKITVNPLKWGLSKARYKIERLELVGITRAIKFGLSVGSVANHVHSDVSKLWSK
jgi:hypothetical protein